MDITIGVILYFLVGILINRLYKSRDIRLSSLVDIAIYNTTRNNFSSIAMDTMNYAGYWFWRRRKPFDKWSWNVKYVIGFIFWPIDLIMSEIGYKKEFIYLESKNMLTLELKRYIKMDIKECGKLQKMMMARIKKG